MAMIDVIQLSRALGSSALDAAILAEGNASGHATESTFWIKASGKSLEELDDQGLAEVAFSPILAAVDGPDLDDAQVKQTLQAATVKSARGAMPSVETFMHAFLLRLPGVAFVGHTHPTPLLALLCLEQAEELAKKRLFPDEIVCCGPESVFVPYTDPGLPLARVIRERVVAFIERTDECPKTIWLQNHGLIALGASVAEIESATRMAVKAARVTLAAIQTGAPIHWFSGADIARIHKRPDEHYRQRLLRGL
ncbi:MAG: class II aldolase/adducin family protein [Armatimonadetes bacterium]|nr:class II aldolase/adducin family protein [Armatimonadota bacterium]